MRDNVREDTKILESDLSWEEERIKMVSVTWNWGIRRND